MLRHDPIRYGVELDRYGWVSAADAIRGLKDSQSDFDLFSVDDLESFLASGEFARFELHEGRIRARYGHSIPIALASPPSQPPESLYHGTAIMALPSIKRVGLVPMKRRFVHLAAEPRYATRIQDTHRDGGVLLRVDARAAARKSNVRFWHASDAVWLADPIPSRFVELVVRRGESGDVLALPVNFERGGEEMRSMRHSIAAFFEDDCTESV